MKDHIKYTVVIPYFNSQSTIFRLLESIPRREDIEIIIINDNCRTFNEVKNALEPSIKSYVNDSGKKGAGACRNIGINNAKGVYLIFADSDDFFTESAFCIFDSFYDKKYDVVYFSPSSLFSDNTLGCERHRPYEQLVDNFLSNGDHSVRYHFHVPWSKLVKKEVVDHFGIRFDEIVASNDVNFSLKVGHYASRIAASTGKVYCVVESQGSLTKTFTKEIVAARFKAFCDFNLFLRNHGVENQKVRMLFFLRLLISVDFFLFLKSLYFVLKNRLPII